MWLVYSFLVLGFWSFYAIYGERATRVHGPWISMAIEAVFMVLLAAIGMYAGRNDISKITTKSLFDGSIMALAAGGGFLILLLGIAAYPEKTGSMLLISGLYPVTMVIISTLFYGGKMAPHQWVAALGAALCMVVFNWPK